MKCARCQHENRPGAKFCEECATPLARACANCGAPLSATAKFCSECAHPVGREAQSTSQRFGVPEAYTPKHLAEKILTSKSALEGERKQVTVVCRPERLDGAMSLSRSPRATPPLRSTAVPPSSGKPPKWRDVEHQGRSVVRVNGQQPARGQCSQGVPFRVGQAKASV